MIPYNKFLLDSAKFFIDVIFLKEIKIDAQIMVIDANNGTLIDEFKKQSLDIPYKGHKIRLVRVIKVIPDARTYDKVMFYFPAKVSPETYFGGITKKMVLDVVSFLRDSGFINFDDINHVYNHIEVKDMDIKVDYKIPLEKIKAVIDYNKILVSRFNGYPSEIANFNNAKSGIGIQCYNRNKTTLAKPFMKFYSKSNEIFKDEFWNLLSTEDINELETNFIYRYEFTLKTIEFFKEFRVENYLNDIFKVSQERWLEISRHYLIKNFETEIKENEIPNFSKLTPTEKIIVLSINAMKKAKIRDTTIKAIFETSENKSQRLRDLKLFDRCFNYSTYHKKESKRLTDHFTNIIEFDKLFHFTQ